MKDKIFGVLQRVGRSFMLPIAILPVAGLLLGIGQSLTNETMLNAYGLMGVMGPDTIPYAILKVCGDCGNAVFGNLPLIFAIGVAVGMARAEKEVAALAGAIAFFIMHTAISAMISLNGGAEAMREGATASVLGITSLQMGVFGGIIVGLGVSALHNRFYKIKLPEVLSFFGGTRFVPVICTVVFVFVGILMYFIWPPIQDAMYAAGGMVSASGYFGTFIYGIMERALIPFGLHHVFYLPFWQTSLGGTMEIGGKMVDGAQNIFFVQFADPGTTHFAVSATRFMTGKFPLMIFGLPGAAFAMYRCARPEKRKAVAGLLASAALTSMLTGITEPLEFTFLFVAPGLYAIHCVFAGAAYMLMHILKVCVGLTFSGGIIDMFLFGILQGQAKTNWLMFIPVGIVYCTVYYFLFSFLIRKLDLKTPGREKEEQNVKLYTRADVSEKPLEGDIDIDGSDISALIVAGLGGKSNVKDVDCCVTRLRCTISDPGKVNDRILRESGSRGIVKKGDGVQIIYGPLVTVIKSNLEDYLASSLSDRVAEAPRVPVAEEVPEVAAETVCMPVNGEVVELDEVEDEVFAEGMLGQGFAIRPSDGKVISPVDGTVTALYSSKHAIGITGPDGLEVLVHIGLNTVQLEGRYFEAYVKSGDNVKKGQKLITFDLSAIEKEYNPITPVLVLNSNKKLDFMKKMNDAVTANTDVLQVQFE
mgnify:CR=1 FL=1